MEHLTDLNTAARSMLRLRYWQHLLNEMLKQRRFQIPIHMAFGHEAAAVALSGVAQPDDGICVTHRNVAYNLARQQELQPVLDCYELAGDPTKVHMGSMNLALAGNGILYASSILGNNLAVAAGIAMNRRLTYRPGVVFAITGDGAIEEGVFWEVLLLARSHRLPLVVVVEDNDYSLASTIAERRCAVNLRLICEGLGVGFQQACGGSFPDMEQALGFARASALAGTPVCVTASIKTFCQHAGPTPGWPGDPLEIDIVKGMILEESDSDPLYDIRQRIGSGAFDEIQKSVVADERVR
jgi:TPP-dependent pyruvate/acetoin dehydrogenase alpha subunit